MRNRLLGMLASTVIVFAACEGAVSPSPTGASPTPGESPGETVAPSPDGATVDLFGTTYPDRRTAGQEGGTVIFADWQEANLFNPFYQGQVTEANVASAVQRGLVYQTDDYKYAPDIAEEIPTVDNGGAKIPGDGGDAMTLTWQLRDDVVFSDGEPLTCDDFVFTLDWVLDPDNTGLFAGTGGYEDISSIDCPSDTEMVWHFENVYEGYILLFSLGNGGMPLPEHYMSQISVKDATTGKGYLADELPNTPVLGPFKFESVTPGIELRLVRNDLYRNPWTGEAPYLDSIIFKWYGDADAMIAGFRGGEHDIAYDLQDSDIPKVEDLGDQVLALPALLYEFLRPNHSATECSPAITDRGDGCPMSDPAMREALAYAIDKNEINTRLLGGNTVIANTNIVPQVWFYADQPPATYDPDRANQILDDAGWTVGSDGIREKDGLKAKIELCTTTRQVRIDTLTLVAAWLKDIGVDAVVNAVSAADIFASFNEATEQTPCALSRHNFDLAEHAFQSSVDPLGNYGVYHSSQVEPAGQNSATVNDPAIDKALETVKNNLDFDLIGEAMAEFQRLYVEQTVEVPLYYRKDVILVSPTVQNFTGNPTQQGQLWNAADWWIE